MGHSKASGRRNTIADVLNQLPIGETRLMAALIKLDEKEKEEVQFTAGFKNYRDAKTVLNYFSGESIPKSYRMQRLNILEDCMVVMFSYLGRNRHK